MINLAIISNIRLYREGLVRILNDVAEIDVICITGSENKLLKCIEKKRLDVVLLDMGMENNFQELASLARQDSSIKIIVMGVSNSDDKYLICAEEGITGYLSRDSTVDELIEAIILVNKGDVYCPSDITKCILSSIKKHSLTHVEQANKMQTKEIMKDDVLTIRESQIIKLLAQGMSNKKIANTLTIEISTVKNHVHNILVKMGAENRAQAACMLRG